MAYIKLYFTLGGGQVEPSDDGVGYPVEYTLRSDLNEVGIPIGLIAKSDVGYVCDDVVIILAGITAAKWALAGDNAGSPGTFEDYGDPLDIGDGVDDITGVPFWIKAKATSEETPVNDISVTIVVVGIAAAK